MKYVGIYVHKKMCQAAVLDGTDLPTWSSRVAAAGLLVGAEESEDVLQPC